MSAAVIAPEGFDQLNLRAFTSFGAVNYFSTIAGWLDPGESALVAAAIQGMERPRVLDIGVGAGRTVPMMRDLAGSYVAIDMAERLVQVCRRMHAGVDVRVMDARAMSFPADSFDLVTFSYNGLDAVPPPERDRVLAEVVRVLRPGGVFAFSSLNRDGPGFNEKFRLTAPRPGKALPMELLRVAAKGAVGFWNYRRNRRYHTSDPGLAVCTSAAHNYGVVAVFASLTAQRAALAGHGLLLEQAFSNIDGARLPLDRDDRSAVWLHYLARKRVLN